MHDYVGVIRFKAKDHQEANLVLDSIDQEAREVLFEEGGDRDSVRVSLLTTVTLERTVETDLLEDR